MLEKCLADVLPFTSGDMRQQLLEKLFTYAELLVKWNNVYNLTAITKMEDIAYKHFLDSLLVLPYLQGDRIIDVGTGAGLPGIPLALSCQGKQFTLLDSNNKKIRFLRQVITELGLKNVTVIHARSEEFMPANKFDTVIVRAFAALPIIIEKTQHLVAPHGEIVAMKGKVTPEDLTALPAEFVIQETIRVDTKTEFSKQLGKRHIIRVTKKG